MLIKSLGLTEILINNLGGTEEISPFWEKFKLTINVMSRCGYSNIFF